MNYAMVVSKRAQALGLAEDSISSNANKVLYIGSWLGFLTRALVEKYPSINFYEVDMDTRCKEVSGRFNYTFKNYRSKKIKRKLIEASKMKV